MKGRAAKAAAADRDKLAKECLRRFQKAETDFNRHRPRIEDCYKFGMPWRHKTGQDQPSDQLDEIFDDTLMTVLEDFSADMLNTFTPSKATWLELEPVQRFGLAAGRELEAPVEEFREAVFAEMRRSNLYQALQEAYLDLGPGTMALIVQDRHPSEPIHCQAIPCTELRINRGPWGTVDDVFRKWRLSGEAIGLMWPKAAPPEGMERDAFAPGKTQEHDVVDGLWRDWSDPAGDAKHRYVVLVGAKVAHDETFTGAGSSPFIVARWSRDSTTAWGMGPTYRTLPSVKTINHVKFLGLKNLDKVVDPPVSYEDDGVMNVDHGVEPGTWIPRAAGSDAPEVVESKARFDVQMMQVDELRSEIRRAHYQDRPEQTGKTPPTATQWADEAAERARRMGSPATNLVIELQYPLFKRFAYLLARRGKLPKVELNGEAVALEPISPLLRAQEQEEVVRFDRFLELVSLRFGPEMANAWIKQDFSLNWLAEKMGVPVQAIRTPEEMAAALQQMAPLLEGSLGGEASAQTRAAA